jgi:uncharacterized protein (DUF433 family)
MIPLPLDPQSAPIEIYEGKVYLVRGTRVPLETVVGAFEAGMSAEGIVDAFPALALADVYAVIAYYLGHRSEVDVYVAGQAAAGERVVAEATATPEYRAWREQLLARAGRPAKAG